MNEKELIQQLKEGREQAYRFLIRKYEAGLLNVIYGIILDREESRDILQEVFLKVYKNIGGFEERSKLYTWLRRIAVNECFNWKRRLKRRFRRADQSVESDVLIRVGGLEDAEENPESLFQKRELAKILNKELQLLPEDARSVLILREMEGLSYDEIAGLLNIKKGTVSSRLHYARKRLSDAVKNYDRGIAI